MKRISLPALGMGIVSKINKNRQVSVCAAHKKSRINNCLFYFFVFKPDPRQSYCTYKNCYRH